MSNNIIITNTAVLSILDTDYILTVGQYFSGNTANSANNSNNYAFSNSILTVNNLVTNTYLQSVLSNTVGGVSNTYLQSVLSTYASNAQVNLDVGDLDGGSF